MARTDERSGTAQVATQGGHADVCLYLLGKKAQVNARVDLRGWGRGHWVELGEKKRDDQDATPLFFALCGIMTRCMFFACVEMNFLFARSVERACS